MYNLGHCQMCFKSYQGPGAKKKMAAQEEVPLVRLTCIQAYMNPLGEAPMRAVDHYPVPAKAHAKLVEKAPEVFDLVQVALAPPAQAEPSEGSGAGSVEFDEFGSTWEASVTVAEGGSEGGASTAGMSRALRVGARRSGLSSEISELPDDGSFTDAVVEVIAASVASDVEREDAQEEERQSKVAAALEADDPEALLVLYGEKTQQLTIAVEQGVAKQEQAERLEANLKELGVKMRSLDPDKDEFQYAIAEGSIFKLNVDVVKCKADHDRHLNRWEQLEGEVSKLCEKLDDMGYNDQRIAMEVKANEERAREQRFQRAWEESRLKGPGPSPMGAPRSFGPQQGPRPSSFR